MPSPFFIFKSMLHAVGILSLCKCDFGLAVAIGLSDVFVMAGGLEEL